MVATIAAILAATGLAVSGKKTEIDTAIGTSGHTVSRRFSWQEVLTDKPVINLGGAVDDIADLTPEIERRVRDASTVAVQQGALRSTDSTGYTEGPCAKD